jgi:hypothetical protein
MIRVLRLPGRMISTGSQKCFSDCGRETEDGSHSSSVLRLLSNLDQICGSLHLRQCWKRDPQRPIQPSPPFFPGAGLAMGARKDAGDLAQR